MKKQDTLQDATVVTIDPRRTLGPIRPMNAVNNGPAAPNDADFVRCNFHSYKAARIPYARIHDSNHCVVYGAPHTVDVTAIFPDFDADVDDPASYDFEITDKYLGTIVAAGTEVFFRLGQSIRVFGKKDDIMPPKDNGKWASICEHIVRHYTEGWANGHKWRITYWEIWNEPDLGVPADGSDVCNDPHTWGGTSTQFFDLFRVAVTHLKKCFPHLKFGGPALAGLDWADPFLAHMRKHKVPIDFFTWHRYDTSPRSIASLCDIARGKLDKHGYKKTESILDEWNYVKDWGPSQAYAYQVKTDRHDPKAAAFVAGTMSACQDKPLDMLMYYDARVGTVYNGMFDIVTLEPLKGYFPFYAWSKLRDLGTQVESRVDWCARRPCCDIVEDDRDDTYATAAVSKNGRHGAVLVTRYNFDNNVTWHRRVRVRLAGGAKFGKLRCHLTDFWRTYTEFPLEQADDGSVLLFMEPCSFALLEW